MGKVFNVDEYLVSNEIVIELGKKEFTVTDVSEEVRVMMKQEDVDQKEIVKKMLGCEDEDLAGYGMAAFSGITKHIMESLFPSLLAGNL